MIHSKWIETKLPLTQLCTGVLPMVMFHHSTYQKESEALPFSMFPLLGRCDQIRSINIEFSTTNNNSNNNSYNGYNNNNNIYIGQVYTAPFLGSNGGQVHPPTTRIQRPPLFFFPGPPTASTAGGATAVQRPLRGRGGPLRLRVSGGATAHGQLLRGVS